jgi:organic radical activating enzyme
MRVNEIFVSIQGEGPEAGRRAIFVRFSGCNLSCHWCDSKYALHTYVDQSAAQLIEVVERSKCRYVVLTGGEPTIQEEFDQLVAALSYAGYSVDVETNGTNLPTKLYPHLRYIVSPKTFGYANNWLAWLDSYLFIPDIMVFKFVVDIDNMDELWDWILSNDIHGAYFMPKTMNVKANTECMVKELTETGRIIMSEMIRHGIDGYLCTRLQNLYRVR